MGKNSKCDPHYREKSLKTVIVTLTIGRKWEKTANVSLTIRKKTPHFSNFAAGLSQMLKPNSHSFYNYEKWVTNKPLSAVCNPFLLEDTTPLNCCERSNPFPDFTLIRLLEFFFLRNILLISSHLLPLLPP